MMLRHRSFDLLAAALLVSSFSAPPSALADATSSPDGQQRPLGAANLALRDPGVPSKRQVRFSGTWKARNQEVTNPKALTSVLRVKGAGPGDGDSGPITLDATKWKAKGKRSFRYTDAKGTAGGIRSIRVTYTPTGGTLKILGGNARWSYAVAQQQSQISVLLSVGSARWCAMFGGGFKKNAARRVDALSTQAPPTCPCADDTNSTWEAIQKHIFAKHGCTAAACHGTGGNTDTHLDLTPANAHAGLVGQASDADPTKQRVKIFAARDSLLYLKLAKATLVEGFTNVPKSPMPLGTPPLSKDELEVVRLWIQAGAPAQGVVGGTSNLLQSCLPPPDPIKAEPVPPPAQTEGVQFYAPPWDIAPRDPAGTNGEGEVCYATWYDFSAQVPPEFRSPCPDYWGGPDRECFLFNRPQLTQDPNSHHSIIHIYRGEYRDDPANTEAFGEFKCLGGPNAGQACDPKGPGSQCPAGGCSSTVLHSIACFGFGPRDLKALFQVGVPPNQTTYGDNLPTVGGSQQPFLDEPYPPGVFGALPLKGTMVWNSHAFNVSDRPTTNEQYFNVFFAPEADRQFVARGIFEDNKIFVQDVPPYEQREYCNTHTVPQGARVFQLSSHNHKRGVLWRTWEPPNAPCAPGPRNDPACTPDTSRPPTVVSTTYNDPTLFRYDTPAPFDSPDPATRTFKFCSVFDNGGGDPTNVKMQSASIATFVGGKCAPTLLQCLATGASDPRKGKLCAEDGTADDRACDSGAGANDGRCDACPLRGGVTTEDEMFILTGLGFCAPGTPCESAGF